jgi:hypothetical protein
MITKPKIMDRSREIKKDWVGRYCINVSENGEVEIKEGFQKKLPMPYALLASFVLCSIRVGH